MRVTVVPIRGHEHATLPNEEHSWEPDESAEHHRHAQLSPSCARCVVGTGDFKLKDPDTKSELDAPDRQAHVGPPEE